MGICATISCCARCLSARSSRCASSRASARQKKALIAVGVMTGAVFSHLTVLGIEVKNDGGLLFILALVVLFCSIFLIFENRNQLMAFFKKMSV